MVKRVYLILKRVISYGREFPKDIKEFGFRAAIWLWFLGVLPSIKGPKYIKFLTKYTGRLFSPITEQFKNGTYDSELHIPKDSLVIEKKPIWVCWLQGEDDMPELVHVCYEQLKKNIPDYAEIRLITLDNYSQYITLPENIIKKFNEGKISMMHLTDFFRVSLLYAYGGMWIDATVWTADKIPDDFFERNFYAQRTSDESKYINEPSRARWSFFLMGGKKGNLIFCYVRNALHYYWEKYDKIIEYILPDYAIIAAYNNLPECKRDIDAVPCNNENLWTLITKINEAYDEKTYCELIQDTTFFKLTYKMDLHKYTKSGEVTYYKYLYDIAKLKT